MDKTVVVGVFQHRHDAQACVNDLKRSGFRDNEIGMVTRDGDAAAETSDNKVGEGAAIGAATGAGVGALWAIGIAAGLLPAIGPVIAGGMLASILASAAGGAAVGGIVGALVGLGIPEEDAEFYESEVKAGRTIVTVKAGTRDQLAQEIIERHNGFERRPMARSGMPANRFSGAAKMPENKALADTDACAVPPTKDAATKEGQRTVELKKEELHTRKENEKVGEVRVRKDVVTERKVMDVPVTREEVVIERHPVDRGKVTTAELRPGEEIRVPVKEEHVHLDKSAHVVEEVTVGKKKIHETKHVAGEVRHEELRVEKEGQPAVKGDTPPRNPK
jgi:uncharacterized protein (TIGR02271 family)